MPVATSVFVFLLCFVALRHMSPQGILFYQGCALGILISLAQIAIVRLRRGTAWSTALKDGLITVLLIYAFVFTVPVTADRSYSVKMLHHLGEAPRGLSRDEVNRLYVLEFVDRGGVDKRLLEQQATGTIVWQNDTYVLTAKGQFLERAFRWTCKLFACQES